MNKDENKPPGSEDEVCTGFDDEGFMRLPSGSKMGRPRIIETPDEFIALAEAYVADCINNKVKLTLNGLGLYCGLAGRKSIDGMLDRKNEAGERDFLGPVKWAKAIIEQQYESGLHTNGAAGSIFALKNMGWRDQVDVNSNATVELHFDKEDEGA